MRTLIRVLVAFALLLGLGIVALAVTLPRLVRSEEVRGRIAEAAREATGRDFAYGELDVGVLPPRLVVTDARLSGERAGAEPTVEGADVQLRLALLPLLARAVVVDNLVLEGATLRLTRTKDGIALPRAEGAAPAEPEQAEGAGAMALAVRRVRLRDLRLLLEDRTVSPPVTWDLSEVEADLRGTSLEAPLDVDLKARLGSGGSLAVKGRVSQSGPVDLELTLDAVDLASAAPYLGKGRKVAGRVSGSVRAQGEELRNPGVVLDLRLADADIAMDEIALRGAARLAAELSQLEAPSGSFQLDATDAALRYGASFEKPTGSRASLEGRVVPGENGAVVLEDTRLRLRNLDGRLRVETGPRTRLRLDAAPFELDGWEALLPALADAKPRGRLGFEGLDVVAEPLAVRGRILLDDLRIARASGPDLTLRGALVGQGDAVSGENLVADVGGQQASVDLRVENLARSPRASLRTQLEDADSNALLTTFAGKRDLMSGPLDANADLVLPLGGSAAVVEALAGTVRFSIEPGRLKGVSLLRSAFERFGAFGDIALLAGQIKGGEKLQRFYGDDFKLLSGTLRLAGGVARSDDLRIVYRNYSVDLRGAVGLADQSLDLTGTLTMDEEVDAALQGQDAAGQAPAAIPEGGAARGRQKVLPLARVVGTLGAPKVELTREAVVAFATRTGRVSKERGKLAGEIDERLGEGAGEQVLDVLEGILGGRGRR